MEMTYKGKTYKLVELVEPHTHELHDIIAIFEIKNSCDGEYYDFGRCINYFYGATCTSLEMCEKIAQQYIDQALGELDNEKRQ